MKHSEKLDIALELQLTIESLGYTNYEITTGNNVLWLKPLDNSYYEIMQYVCSVDEVVEAIERLELRAKNNLKPLKKDKYYDKDGNEVIDLDGYSLNDLYIKD